MKIAILSWESLHSIPAGGISYVIDNLSQALKNKGHEVHVFTRIGPNQQIYEEIDGVRYHRCPFAFNHNLVHEMNNMCKSMVHFFFETEKVIGAFDIVHGHDWHVVNALDEIKKAGRKVLFTLHSTQYGRDGNQFNGGIAQDIHNLEWYGTYIAERVTVCTEAMKNEVCWLHRVPDWKIKVVFNAIDYHRFDGFIDPWNDVKKWYGIGVYDPVILFVGRMTYQKGGDMLVEAIPDVLKDYPNAKFVFIGDGYMKAHLEHRCRELGIMHAVRFTGYVPENVKINWLKACDMVVVPSRNEPFGIVVLEAWASGKPVIATHGTGAGELVWHEVTGLRVYQNPNSIAWGIKTLLGDLDRAKWMGKNGRNAVEKVFNWNNVANKMLEVYEEVLRG
ncbi:MAG TPA: glycosyltransferase family 1 protein [Candidatus Aenigmarchaeota archaeon]|nr:glycosyltransferase family 1 protein [Candidatus Aenigmarchaeota archaeon]